MGKPVNKWIQSVFWPISVLPSFQHIPKHSADDYVGRTSPLLGTCLAFWVCAIGAIVIWGIVNNLFLGDMAWRGAEEVLGIVLIFVGVLYVIGFWLFMSREDIYPN